MTYKNINYNDLSINIQLSFFAPKNGAKEIHCMVLNNNPEFPTEIQFKHINIALSRMKSMPDFEHASCIWKRFFVSDAVNQAKYLTEDGNEAISVVQQAPMNGTKVAVWLYFIENCVVTKEKEGIVSFRRGSYKHIIHTQLHDKSADIIQQTDAIFDRYTKDLSERKLSLKNNCIRTWIYVQNVDIQYAGMVKARREYFEKEDLRPETHYIASTGIEGRYIYPEVLVLMDTYAIEGIGQEQITFLHAPTHLNPTYEYGVTFERGAVVNYGDRRHVFISGTASINNKGEIVHPQDIHRQTERTLENIHALLTEAESGMQDVAQMIVYLRDTADTAIVSKYLSEHYPDIPQVMVWAPVCRPGWLIEIECIAIKQTDNKLYDNF